MNTRTICKDLAESIADAYFSGGGFSGFSSKGIENIADNLEKLVVAIKDELKDEMKRELKE